MMFLFFIFVATGFVFFLELCKIDARRPVHLITMICKVFGLCTFFGYVFEPQYVDLVWFKWGVGVYLIGSSGWLLLGRHDKEQGFN